MIPVEIYEWHCPFCGFKGASMSEQIGKEKQEEHWKICWKKFINERGSTDVVQHNS